MQIKTVGLIGKWQFHAAHCLAKDLYECFPDAFKQPLLNALYEQEWVEFLHEKKRKLGGEYWAFDSVVFCFCNGKPIGDFMDLHNWAKEHYHLQNYRPRTFYEMLAYDSYRDNLMRRNTYVSMAITIGGDSCGTLLFELYSDIVPKTCANFIKLCTGELGIIPKNDCENYRMHYLDTIFFRLVPDGWIQGGDTLYGSGNDGRSIYGDKFEDENFAIKHDKRGVLSMVNKGRHTNSSQFMIVFQPAPWMDYRYVAFGCVFTTFPGSTLPLVCNV
ncbi:putative inactive peptidyl-prolyl cis-tran isomerase-like 6 [Taenia solium]